MLVTICIAICLGRCTVSVCSPAPLIGIILKVWSRDIQESFLESVLVFYDCCNKWPQIQCLKTTHIYLTVSVSEKSRWAWPGPLCRVSQAEIKAVFLTEGSGGKSASKLIQVVGQIQFLALVGLRAPFPCWLSTFLLLSVWPLHKGKLSPSHA